jgi:asparagine synthase (glutamine-hydrolysing)
MCGITGFWADRLSQPKPQLLDICQKMSQSLRHRGPDSEGQWASEKHQLVLGHRRLSILDLSQNGAQPMQSPCGRYVMVYNGEVYNHLDLRPALEKKYKFRGHSDTETMLAAFSEYGILNSISKFNGMFACAVWDQQTSQLTLIRDRMGVKPLYYGRVNQSLVFGSELKPFQRFPDFVTPINRDALALFMGFGYIPAPQTIYEGIYKLPAGCFVTINPEMSKQSFANLPAPQAYWSLDLVASSGQARPLEMSPEDLNDELEKLLTDAVKLRMLSDVPVGAFLSGGIDSSLVVALMQKISSQPVKTFTIGFAEQQYNEAPHARAVADVLKTDHTELIVSPEQALDVIPMLPTMYDEPFADSSQIPTYLVSKLAREKVIVSLSGDGGDELFCGYNRYFHSLKLWKKLSRIPGRSLFAPLLRRLQALPSSMRMGKNLESRADLLTYGHPDELYRDLFELWPSDKQTVIRGDGTDHLLWDHRQWIKLPDAQHRYMWLDSKTYLPEDILTKVDRASMAVGLEARVPLLDYRVVEFAWKLPLSAKTDGVRGKLPLMNLLSKYVPRQIIDRPKMGFGVPIDTWLKGPLRDWAEDLLSPLRLELEGYLQPIPIRKRWNEHLAGKNRWHYALWNALMFQSWLENNR